MPLAGYGVLVGHLVDGGASAMDDGHLHLCLAAEGRRYRVSLPWDSAEAPVEALVIDRFRHPVTRALAGLAAGFTGLEAGPAGRALDYIRYNLADPRAFVRLSSESPAAMDVQATIFNLVRWLGLEPFSRVYAFGVLRESPAPDPVFGFAPGAWVKDVHMNQGSPGRFLEENGWWQDGGLLVQQPDRGRWTAVFTKFASQHWHTTPEGARPFPPAGPGEAPFDPLAPPTRAHPDGWVRVVGIRPARGRTRARVVLLNTGPKTVSLEGWALSDTAKRKHPLAGRLGPGAARAVDVAAPFVLEPEGGIVSVLDDRGWKVSGIAYLRDPGVAPGWVLVP